MPNASPIANASMQNQHRRPVKDLLVKWGFTWDVWALLGLLAFFNGHLINGAWENAQLFKDLRSFSKLKGKCGKCDYLRFCGGCRARAYEATGDYMSEEPYCAYRPPALARM